MVEISVRVSSGMGEIVRRTRPVMTDSGSRSLRPWCGLMTSTAVRVGDGVPALESILRILSYVTSTPIRDSHSEYRCKS
jgi:hypothetical protein